VRFHATDVFLANPGAAFAGQRRAELEGTIVGFSDSGQVAVLRGDRSREDGIDGGAAGELELVESPRTERREAAGC